MPTLVCLEAVLQWSCGQHLVYVFLFRVCSRARASDSKREERPPYGQTSEHRFSRIVVQIRGRTVSDDPFSLSYATVHRQKKLLGIDFGWRWRACMPALLWSDAVLQWSWSTSGPSVPKVCGFACAHALQIVNMKKDPRMGKQANTVLAAYLYKSVGVPCQATLFKKVTLRETGQKAS